MILDLPDVDSVAAAHRASVEEVLPRVDAVAWVTDPEKYADALLHDEFLRTWLPRLDRQVVVLNKADRLAPDAADRVHGDLGRVLATELVGSSSTRPDVLVVSATGGSDGIAPFRAWLFDGIDAKAMVAGRLAAATVDAVEALARAGGAWGERGRRPLIEPARRQRASRPPSPRRCGSWTSRGRAAGHRRDPGERATAGRRPARQADLVRLPGVGPRAAGRGSGGLPGGLAVPAR